MNRLDYDSVSQGDVVYFLQRIFVPIDMEWEVLEGRAASDHEVQYLWKDTHLFPDVGPALGIPPAPELVIQWRSHLVRVPIDLVFLSRAEAERQLMVLVMQEPP
jgi:hypothetical protein